MLSWALGRSYLCFQARQPPPPSPSLGSPRSGHLYGSVAALREKRLKIVAGSSCPERVEWHQFGLTCQVCALMCTYCVLAIGDAEGKQCLPMETSDL